MSYSYVDLYDKVIYNCTFFVILKYFIVYYNYCLVLECTGINN